VKCYAASGFGPPSCEQQASLWGGVVAGQFGQFLFEALETKAEIQGLSVFEEKFADSIICCGNSACRKSKP